MTTRQSELQDELIEMIVATQEEFVELLDRAGNMHLTLGHVINKQKESEENDSLLAMIMEWRLDYQEVIRIYKDQIEDIVNKYNIQ